MNNPSTRARLSQPAGRFMVGALCLFTIGILQAEPIRLHPENPRWFEWRGKATALITSAEHYGAVLNLDFDYQEYLETMEREGMNYTRLFTGSYVEPPGAFGIGHNTLAPASGRFIAPWARSDQPGYAAGGNKFDLASFNPDYLARLRDFISEAARRGIVVELTFFSSTYGEPQWAIHPLNPANNIQGYSVENFRKLNTSLNNPKIMEVQEQLVCWLVRELNGFDNLFYEFQNEPWADNHTMGDFINPYLVDHHKWPNAVEVTLPESVEWQRTLARVVVNEEKRLPKKHLLAQNIANFRLAVTQTDLVPETSIINFHYAYPEVVDWNRGFRGVIGYDETGFAGREDTTYRRQAWNFMLSGGALFNNLDYSFSVGNEDGQDTANAAPGGGSSQLRKHLSVLADFLHGFELEKLNPNFDLVNRAPGLVARVLSEPGNQYALYLQGRAPEQIELNLPMGSWNLKWIDTQTGITVRSDQRIGGDTPTSVQCPEFEGEIAVKITQGGAATSAAQSRQRVIEYLKDRGRGSYLFGQMATWVHNEDPDMDHPSNWIKKVRDHTGRLPRYGCITYDFHDNPFSDAVWNDGVKKLWERGMIVGVYTFFANPSGGNWNDPCQIEMIWASDENAVKTHFYAQLDRMAANLHWLRDRGISVVYTPFVESDDRNKWHAKQGSQSIIRLYRLVHDYLQVSKGLDNIIWAYHTTQNDGALERCYPGDGYVDVLGKSAYGRGLVFSEYDWAVTKKRQGKVIWWAELGIRGESNPPRDCLDVLQKLESQFPELAGFVFWSDAPFYNVVGNLNAQEFMAHPKIVSLDR